MEFSSNIPIPNVLQDAPRPVHRWLLKTENQTAYGEFTGPCPCPNVCVQALEDGAVCMGKCVDKDRNPLGLLTIQDIRNLLTSKAVRRFNYDEDPEVFVDPGSDYFFVRRPGHPEYSFNERGAAEAVFVGNRLMLPDAQGFPCVLYFDPD